MATTETKPSDPNLEAPAIDWRTKIGPDPRRPGRAWWRLREENVAVWAIIQDILMFDGVDDATRASPESIAAAADGFLITEEAVRAALAYYDERRRWIDALLLINGFDDVDD